MLNLKYRLDSKLAFYLLDTTLRNFELTASNAYKILAWFKIFFTSYCSYRNVVTWNYPPAKCLPYIKPPRRYFWFKH